MLFGLVFAAALAQEAPVALPPVDLRTVATTAVLKTCLSAHPTLASSPVEGRLTLQVQVKRGRIALVTATDAAPSALVLVPCFERELVGFDWDVKKGTFEVPVEVPVEVREPAEVPEPVVE